MQRSEQPAADGWSEHAGDPSPATEELGTQRIADALAQPAPSSEQRLAGEEAERGERPAEGGALRERLLDEDEVAGLLARWKEIQVGFVDQPRDTVAQADALVADLMQRLAAMFASERQELEAQWSRGEQVSTEDLRQNLQRYRSFFERLLTT
jgi:hypothetical protein